MRPKILIADPLETEGLQALRTWADVDYRPDRHGLASGGDDVVGLVVRAPISQSQLDAFPRLRVIVRCGAGLDGIPLDYTAQRGITVANTPGANADSVAEYVFAALFEVARGFGSFAASLSNGDWARRSEARTRSFELHGKRLGIIGMGEIGLRVARIGRHGFGMHVRATTTSGPRVLPDFVKAVRLDSLCSSSDVLVVCCSLNETTRGLIGADQLAALPRGSVLINVARGAVIDETALLRFAAQPERTTALVLDVHHRSPLPADHPLLRAPLCWTTPHFAAITADSERRTGLATERVLRETLHGGRE